MLRSNADLDAVVVGIFPRVSDARRALNALREQRFSADEVAAAFREQNPVPVETEQAPSNVHANRDWFGQLRELYHGDDRLESTRRGTTAPLAPQATPTSLEATLAQLDLSSQETRTLDRDLDRGAAIVAVTAGARNPEAQTLLKRLGARIVNGRQPEQPAVAGATPGPVVTSTPFDPPPPADPGHIQLFGEVLRVRKEKVANGEVHVRKESVTHMETVQVPVTREYLVVEYSDENGRTDPERSIRVPLSEERIHIDKDTVLREEYKVGKREVTQNESVSDSVRRERLLIDEASATPGDRTTSAASVGTTTQAVVGLFNNLTDAHKAVTELRANAFGSGQIGAAFRGRSLDRYTNTGDTATSTRANHYDRENWWEKIKDAFRADDKVEARREAAADSTLHTDPYAQDEYDFADNTFEGALAGTGIRSDRAAHLSRNLQPGGAIVTVHDADRAADAEQILFSNGGKVHHEDIAGADRGTDVAARDAAAIDAADSSGREITDTGYTDRRPVDVANSAEDWIERGMTDTGYSDRRSADVANSAVDRVRLFGEVLRVLKERISRGEVRVRKDVISENQTIEVPITREELVLERVAVPANTPATSASIGSGREIRVPLSEDSVRLEKQPVVREDVLVSKREVADVAKVGDDVRHEELRVDSDGEIPKRTATGEELPDERRRHG